MKETESPLFLLIAGNLLEADRFARSAGLPNSFWTHISKPDQLRGLRGANIRAIKIGTWYELTDIKLIDRALLIQDIPVQEVTVEKKKQQKNRYVAILQSVLVRIDLAKFPRIRWNLKRKKDE